MWHLLRFKRGGDDFLASLYYKSVPQCMAGHHGTPDLWIYQLTSGMLGRTLIMTFKLFAVFVSTGLCIAPGIPVRWGCAEIRPNCE